MYVIENENARAFAGYGTTMGNPLWFPWREATQVVIFATEETALKECESLHHNYDCGETLTVRPIGDRT